MKTHALSFRGLRPVIAYLEAHPDKTHLLALKSADGVHDLVVTPKRSSAVVRQLQKRALGTAAPVETLVQTL